MGVLCHSVCVCVCVFDSVAVTFSIRYDGPVHRRLFPEHTVFHKLALASNHLQTDESEIDYLHGLKLW